MFAIFVADEFQDFWGNKIGDEFLNGTCASLGFNKSQVDVVFFHGLDEKPEFFTFNPDKTLVIQRKVVSTLTEVDPETGVETTTESVSYVTSRTISADPFFSKGESIQNC